MEGSRLDCGASRPPALLWLSLPHSATQLDKCGTDLLPGVPSFSALAFLKSLAKVWEAAVSPLGGLQSAAPPLVQTEKEGTTDKVPQKNKKLVFKFFS